MINRNDPKIEELLNGFLDGELTEPEQAEVQRLISEDKEIARRLMELERCRMLVNSLPPAEPPAEVVAGIKQLIRSRTAPSTPLPSTALGTGPSTPLGTGRTSGREMEIESRRGTRQLFVRHVLAASVMIGLLGLLAGVIYMITSPADIKRPVAIVKPGPAETQKVVTDVANEADIGVYSLRLQTADFTGVDAYVRKLLDESTWLKYESKKEGPGRSAYRVLCSKGGLEALVSDMAAVWSKFDSATLVVHTEDVSRSVAVEDVRPEQITDIAKQDTADARVRLAKDFAALNGIERTISEQTMFAFTDKTYPELTAIPKPVLTSSEKGSAAVPKGANDQVCVDLSIIVSGSTPSATPGTGSLTTGGHK
jgi:hypothetical protein